MRSRSQNQFLFLPKIHSYKFIHNSLTDLANLAKTIIILPKFGSSSPSVTLKNSSRPYKPSELLIVYTHISLVRIRPLVQKSECHANVNAIRAEI